jgi:FKBP-type peptidyl-prolyl cis-trans isomerase SlyD
MIIQHKAVVDLHFTIKDTSGNLLEASQTGEPVSFPLGAGYLLPGIEEALEGKGIGDEIQLELSPERAFGMVNPDMKRVVSMSELDEGESPLEVGDTVALDDSDPVTWTVYKVEQEHVYIDGNHPFAGKTLNVWVKIVGINEPLHPETPGVTNTDGGGCGPGCRC